MAAPPPPAPLPPVPPPMPALAAVPVYPVTLEQARLNFVHKGNAVKILTKQLAVIEAKCAALMRKNTKARQAKGILKAQIEVALDNHRLITNTIAEISAGRVDASSADIIRDGRYAEYLQKKVMDLTEKLVVKDQEFKTVQHQYFEARVARVHVKQQLTQANKELKEAAKIVDDIIAARY